MSSPPHDRLAGRYLLVRAIGEGGMGRVWQARDELLGRDVAVKEITPEGLTRTELGDLRERAIREARAIARVSHPTVVRIFDVIEVGDTPWIVMELIRSRSLFDVVSADGPLPPMEAARIGLEVLAGLRAAHRAGILHRDVKPANVLLAGDGRVVLTDFGLATVAGDSSMTRTGIVLGSPSYLAPERALDKPADARSDLWSLGATLFTAVEGRPPYDRSTPMATLAALMVDPPPVSERAGVLQTVLAALLRKDPAERADAEEAERLLRLALADGTPPPAGVTQRTTAHPAPPATHPAPPVARPGRRLLIAAVAALVVAGGGLAAAWPFTSSTGPTSAAASSSRPAPSSPAGSTPGRALPAAASPAASSSGPPPTPRRRPTTPASAEPAATKPAATKATTVAVGSPLWNHGTGTCLHVPGAGREVQLWQCNGSDNQKFTFPGDGTLRVLGQCVQLGSTAEGSRMRAAACTGSAQQQFTLSGSRDLVGIAADKCVDVPDWDRGDGVPAQIWACAGTDNQKWN